MTPLASILFVMMLACDLRLVAGSRLRSLIQTVALQGVVLAGFPLLLPRGGISLEHAAALALAVAVIKGVVIPKLLLRALHSTSTQREVQPLVGYNLSLLVALALLLLSAWLAQQIALTRANVPLLLDSVAFFTLFCGLFLVMARRQALTQIVGYLVFENGIYAFGVALLDQQALLVEMGVLFDLVVAILVMGLVVLRMEEQLGHSDSGLLRRLRG